MIFSKFPEDVAITLCSVRQSLRKEEDGPEERVNRGSLSVSEETTDDFPMQDKINWRALEVARAPMVASVSWYCGSL